uniref:Uncharacterized protein n=1 Tax=Sphaerodactylus townsendi TaxID=933632 RepID=A0ACB8F217_9SAUR
MSQQVEGVNSNIQSVNLNSRHDVSQKPATVIQKQACPMLHPFLGLHAHDVDGSALPQVRKRRREACELGTCHES